MKYVGFNGSSCLPHPFLVGSRRCRYFCQVDEIVLIAEDVFINLFSASAEQDEAKRVIKRDTINRDDCGNRK